MKIIRTKWLATPVFALLGGLAADVASAQTQNEIQKLLASDGALFDELGDAVAVDGDTAVIGARLDNDNGSDSGSAYVFVRGPGGTWTEQQKLTASDGAGSDFFAQRVAVDGDTIVIGSEADDDDGNSSGSAYVFTRTAGVWTEQQKLTASDAAADDWFGSAVAVEGDTLVVGAERDDDNGTNSGSAYVFTRSGNVWTEQQKLTASNGNDFDFFGDTIAMDGDTIVVGARFGDLGNLFVEQDFGAAYVYTRNNGVWSEQQKLVASDGAKEEQFGISVAIHGDTIVVGAKLDSANGTDSGSAYVFTRNGGVWTEQQKLTASDAAADDEFGESVAVYADSAVIGAWGDDDNGDQSGSAYLFTRSSGIWTEQAKLIASDAAAFDEFGENVAMDGDVIIVGAPREDEAASAAGAVYVFEGPGESFTLDIEALPDVDQSGSVDAAVLVGAADSPTIKVYVKDGATGNTLSETTILNDNWQAIDLTVTPGGSVNALYAVLARHPNGTNRVTVHRADNGNLTRQIDFFNKNWVASALIFVPNADSSGGAAFAVVAKNSNDNRVSVQLRRRSDGSVINTLLYFRNIWDAVDVDWLQDLSGNGRSEVVLVARSDAGRISALIKDAATGNTVNRTNFYSPAATPVSLTQISSVGGGAAVDLPLLGVKNNGRSIVQIRDALTDTVVNSIYFFSAAWDSISVHGLNDVNGNSSADVAALAQHSTNGAIRANVRDASTGNLLNQIKFLGPIWTAHKMAVFDDITGNGVEELGVVGRRSDGTVRVQIRDASTGSGVKTFDVP